MIKQSRGFSLVELMVAMVVSLVVILGAGQLFISLSQTSQRVSLLSEKQAAVNFAVETLLRDIRRADWRGDIIEDGNDSVLTLRVRNRGDMTGCDGSVDRVDKRYSLGETTTGGSGSYSLQVRRRCVPDPYGDPEPLVGGFEEGGFGVSLLPGELPGVVVTLRLRPLREDGDSDELIFYAVNRSKAVGGGVGGDGGNGGGKSNGSGGNDGGDENGGSEDSSGNGDSSGGGCPWPWWFPLSWIFC